MVNFYREFLNCDGGSANISMVVDHIDHIKKISSIDNVGIGSDFDGVGQFSSKRRSTNIQVFQMEISLLV